MAVPTYLFTVKSQPTEPGQENNFGNMQRDASRFPLGSDVANGIQTVDATGTTQKSPLAITTGTTNLVVPINAVSVTLSGSAAMSVSENPTIATNSFLIPSGTVVTIPVAKQANLYVTTASTGNLSFFFSIVQGTILPPDNTAKNPTFWQPNVNTKGYIQYPGLAFIVDQSSNFIVDQSKNFIVSTPDITVPLNTTAWVQGAAS